MAYLVLILTCFCHACPIIIPFAFSLGCFCLIKLNTKKMKRDLVVHHLEWYSLHVQNSFNNISPSQGDDE